MKNLLHTISFCVCATLYLTACGSGSDSILGGVPPSASGSNTVNPAAFSFDTIYSAPPSTITASKIIQVTGLAEPAAVAIDANAKAKAPEYRVCTDAACSVVSADWRSTAGVLNNNDYLQARLDSSASDDTATSVTTHVGAGTASFAVDTKSFCEKSFTQTDHFTAVSSINGQNGWEDTGGFDEKVANVGAAAYSGQNVWQISNKITSGSFGNQPLSPQLSESAGESTVRSAGGGDAMEAVFWIHSVAPTADGSSITINMSPAGGDRMTYLRFDNNLDANGGLQAIVIDYPDVVNTGTWRTFVLSTGMSRTAWIKVRLVLETPDGGSNDIFSVFLNDQLVGTYSSWEDYFTWSLGGNSVTESVDRLLFREAVAPSTVDPSFVDANAQGYYFDNVCYRVYNRATPSSTIQSYRTGFEP
ncbi:MAG TPA: hypothetical protein VMV88_03665 [Gallionella sp.]|nr:hypothetical protein [Gallionella sp.]